MSLKIHAYKILADKFIGEAVDEWNKMYHNASVHNHWPSIEDEALWEEWWEWLGDQAFFLCKDIEEEIGCKVYQYGRSGATIAPDHDFGYHKNGFKKIDCNDLSYFLNYEDAEYFTEIYHEDPSYQQGTEEAWHEVMTGAKEMLEKFELVNRYVKSGLEGLAEGWKYYLEQKEEAA